MLRAPFVQLGAAWCNVRNGGFSEAWEQVPRASRESGMSRGRVLVDVVRSTLLADLRPTTYFYLRMWEMPPEERRTLTPTVLVYRLHQLNDGALRPLLRDKVQFNRAYAAWIGRAWTVLDGAGRARADDFARWLDGIGASQVVVKRPLSQCSGGVRVVAVEHDADGWRVDGVPLTEFVERAVERGEVLIEELLVSHPDLIPLGSKSVCTVRILTRCRPDGSVEIGHAFLRMHPEHAVDGTQGWTSCRIDPVTGRLEGAARRDNGFDAPLEHSPGFGVPYRGFRLPCWDECLQTVRAAARLHPGLTTVGWDVALTPSGPVLLEGNDNWSRCDVMAGRGQRPMFERWYREMRDEQVRAVGSR